MELTKDVSTVSIDDMISTINEEGVDDNLYLDLHLCGVNISGIVFSGAYTKENSIVFRDIEHLFNTILIKADNESIVEIIKYKNGHLFELFLQNGYIYISK
jgi:hypothetical protein